MFYMADCLNQIVFQEIRIKHFNVKEFDCPHTKKTNKLWCLIYLTVGGLKFHLDF